MAKTTRQQVPALRVTQWLPAWDAVKWNPKIGQAKPIAHFFLLSLDAADLKALTGIYRRSTAKMTPRLLDPNVQRSHDEERSATIRDFVEYGYPWCDMSTARRESADFMDLRKPGWLPTAIVVNILKPGDRRDGQTVSQKDCLLVDDNGIETTITFPPGFDAAKWRPEAVHPMEVIDGQHRLWAFEGFKSGGQFQLPVVAFHGLDRSWQAYLFWSINITPKRIKASLAFDLYPLLRTEEWLDRFEGHSIYRETRAQELVEALWAHPESPWHERVNMLGESGLRGAMVSQAAWIRSLLATYVKRWEGQLGGLFGAPLKKDGLVLGWTRAQQAAFLILVGDAVRKAVSSHRTGWAAALRKVKGQSDLLSEDDDRAFYGQYSLLSTDQGIRGILAISNDLCYVRAKELELDSWRATAEAAATSMEAVTAELRVARKLSVASYLNDIAKALAVYDWRTSSTPGLSDEERLGQMVFKGGSGYKELRRQLLLHLGKEGNPAAAKAAKTVAKALNYQ